MTPETIAARTFFFILALAGLGVLCSGLRAYGRDSFRQRAFALRDELFDYAEAGHVSFSDPAYWRLRLAINSTIRYSHRMTFGEATLPLLISTLLSPQILDRPPHYTRWEDAVLTHPTNVQIALRGFDDRFSQLWAQHLLRYTPLAWPLIFAAFVAMNWKDLVRKIGARVEDDAIEDADPEWLAQQGIAAA